MPPKKTKADDKKVPVTPEKSKAKAKAKQETPKKTDPPKKATPRKPASSPVAFQPVAVDNSPNAGGPLPVDVETESKNGLAIQQKGQFRQLLRLEGCNSFNVVKTVMLIEGLDLSQYQGLQAVLIRPGQAFKFGELPDEVRIRVYRQYFACKGVMNEPIVLDGKRPSNKEAYAKTYAESSKNRVALLAVDKSVNKDATAVFYSQTFRFDSTATLIDFLSQVPSSIRPRLSSISIKAYHRTSARNAMHILAEARNLKILHFDSGVSSEDDMAKAVKAFYGDGYKFLESVGAAKGDKAAGVDVLSFDKTAFVHKDGDGKKVWSDEKVAEFREMLKAKLRASHLAAWVCICGSLVAGHRCADEFETKHNKKTKDDKDKTPPDPPARESRRREREFWTHVRHGGGEILAAAV